MKKILLSFSVIFSTVVGVKAQAPDMGFEAPWATIPFNTTKDPVGWASFNAFNVLGMSQTVFEETAAPYAGSRSAKIVTEVVTGASVPNPLVPGQNLDTAGVLGVGRTTLAAPYVYYGYPLTSRYSTLSFGCKYTPNPNSLPGVPDTAYVIAKLTKWNGTSRDEIATGTFKMWIGSTSWSAQSLTMNYNSSFGSVMPDSQQIFISSSILVGTGAKKGSTFYVDDFAWSGYVSTGDIAGQNVQVAIYPNPASTVVNFKSNVAAEKINITDITGRIVGTYDMIDNKISISTENYSSGIYFYNLINANKEVISRDKFEVIK